MLSAAKERKGLSGWPLCSGGDGSPALCATKEMLSIFLGKNLSSLPAFPTLSVAPSLLRCSSQNPRGSPLTPSLDQLSMPSLDKAEVPLATRISDPHALLLCRSCLLKPSFAALLLPVQKSLNTALCTQNRIQSPAGHLPAIPSSFSTPAAPRSLGLGCSHCLQGSSLPPPTRAASLPWV